MAILHNKNYVKWHVCCRAKTMPFYIITNLRITGIFHDRQVFRKFLREKIDCLPGIQNVKIYHVLKVLAKHFI